MTNTDTFVTPVPGFALANGFPVLRVSLTGPSGYVLAQVSDVEFVTWNVWAQEGEWQATSGRYFAPGQGTPTVEDSFLAAVEDFNRRAGRS